MKKLYFLTLHRPNRSPSQRFRFEQYIDFFKANNYKTEHLFLLNESDDKRYYSKGALFAKFLIVVKSTLYLLIKYFQVEADSIVFVQRECYMLGTAFFERLFASKCKLVFDFDDAIWLQNVSDANKRFAFLKNPNKTRDIIKCSKLVIAGNSYLADYAMQYNSNVIVIPTTIDTSYHKPASVHSRTNVVIGWTGSHSTVKYIELILPVFKELKRRYNNLSFKIICEDTFRIEELDVETTKWNADEEIAQLADIDIGVMPLPDDEWTKGKCGFKGLQYMAMQIPAVMSPVGVNTEIISDGVNGFLVADEQQWLEILSRLIENSDLRKKIGEEGRKTIECKYSVNANKQKYLEALNSL